MIDIAIMLALQDSGIGEYGKTLFVNQSPIFGSGKVSDVEGFYVTSSAIGATADTYQDQVTITTRFKDSLSQSLMLAKLSEWVRNFGEEACWLPLTPLFDDLEPLQVIGVPDRQAATTTAVDNEGKFVKQITFTVNYKLPKNLQ